MPKSSAIYTWNSAKIPKFPQLMPESELKITKLSKLIMGTMHNHKTVINHNHWTLLKNYKNVHNK